MREIKFRGFWRNENKWIYGSYVSAEGVHAIMTNHKDGYLTKVQVDPDSVGQFTGLKDKNGVEIYEGDILTHRDFSTGDVRFRDGAFYLHPIGYDEVNFGGTQLHCLLWMNTLEVIGNIYETPELMEVQK